MDIDLDQLRELMKSIQEHDVTEVELEKDGERIVVRRRSTDAQPAVVVGGASSLVPTMPPAQVPAPIAAPAVPVAAVAAPAPATPAAAEDENATFVTSPFVGTFYRSPSPDADPFVKEGTKIEPGTVLCIVEAMKLMNEIESEISGTIVEILADNGKPVEFGDRLFRVE